MKLILWVALLCLTIAAAFEYKNSADAPAAPATVSVAVVEPAPVVEKKPEPFAYVEAVLPSLVPTPKPRPHQRRRPYCKLPAAKPPVFK